MATTSDQQAVDPGGGEDSATTAATVEVAEPSILQQYLRKILPLLLEEGAITPSAALEKCIDSSSNVDLFKKFLSEASAKVLLVRKLTVKG